MKNPTLINSQKGSSRNVFLIVVAVLLIGGAFAFAEYRNQQASSIYKSNQLVASATIESAEIDTDNDGLKDWEEILVGSDPKDEKSKVAITSNAPTSGDVTKKAEPLSQTDLISRDFFARYLEMRQLGSAGDAFSQAEAAQKTVGNIVLPTPKLYVLGDITTKADNSKEAIKQYGNDVASIFQKYAVKSRNEAVIAKEALETENDEILKEIDPIIASYKNITDALVKLPIPNSISTIHLDLVNAMNSAVFVSQSLRNSSTDPIAGVQGVNLYLVVDRQIKQSTVALVSYFSYLGITFSPTEPGYLFRSQI